MPFGKSFEALLRVARAALASLLLVGVPLADAVACAGEGLGAHDVAGVSGETYAGAPAPSDQTDPGNQLEDETQHCVHGHCHQTPFRAADAVLKPAGASTAIAVLPDHQAALQGVASGLERPPKL